MSGDWFTEENHQRHKKEGKTEATFLTDLVFFILAVLVDIATTLINAFTSLLEFVDKRFRI